MSDIKDYLAMTRDILRSPLPKSPPPRSPKPKSPPPRSPLRLYKLKDDDVDVLILENVKDDVSNFMEFTKTSKNIFTYNIDAINFYKENGIDISKIKKHTVDLIFLYKFLESKHKELKVPTKFKGKTEEKKEEKKEDCEYLLNKYSDLTYFHKNSSSSSLILFGKDIVIKIAFKPLDILDNSLLVEEQIYRNIISNLINNNHTPHLIKYIDSTIDCNFKVAKIPLLSDSDRSKIYDRITDIDTRLYNNRKATITVLEQADKLTYHFYLISSSKPPTTDEIFISIFQILYTLSVFSQIGLIHNDLHFDNIFVNKGNKKTFLYNVGKNIISIETDINIKIFDWDRGSIYHPAVDRNFELDKEYCAAYNQCNTSAPVDYEAILALLYKFCQDKDVLLWLDSIVSHNIYLKLVNRKYPQLRELGFKKYDR
jgi:hypothetical protein